LIEKYKRRQGEKEYLIDPSTSSQSLMDVMAQRQQTQRKQQPHWTIDRAHPKGVKTSKCNSHAPKTKKSLDGCINTTSTSDEKQVTQSRRAKSQTTHK
jgi:hypothetical protein